MSLCPICSRPRGWHDACLHLVIAWRLAGQYDVDANPVMVRLLAPVCYLCGTASTEEAEHVHPRRWAGLDAWSNMAGACIRCNRLKRDRIGHLTAEQITRAAEHQTAFRAVHGLVDDALVIDGMASRARKWRPRWDDPELDRQDLVTRLSDWFDETGAPLDLVVRFVSDTIAVMLERQWIEPVDGVDIADELDGYYDPAVVD